MRKSSLFLFLVLCLIGRNVKAIVFPQYPKDLSSPLKIPLNLAGTFGELRNQHYHAGWDLKTDEKTGLEVIAIADGEVTRVKVSSDGYGYVLYVHHPQWQITSVYAHLEDFNSALSNWVRAEQYKAQQFNVDLTTPKGMFSIKRNQVLGFSGNSGSSAGPHLHFEVRNSVTEHPIDPHLLGYQLADITRPVIQRMWLIPQQSSEPPLALDFNFGGEAFGKDSLYEVAPVFGVGVEVYDYVLSADNQCGIQHMITLLDGNIISEWQIDSLDFKATHHVNSHIWKHPKLLGSQFHRGYLPEGAPADHFLYTEKRGVVTIKDTMVHAITVMVADFMGNATCVYAYVQNREEVKQIKRSGNLVQWDKGDTLLGREVDIRIPANALYENAYIDWQEGYDVFKGDSSLFVGWKSNEILWADKPTWHLKSNHTQGNQWGWYNETSGDWKNIDSLGNARMKLPGRNFLVMDTLPPAMTKMDNKKLATEWKNRKIPFFAQVQDDLSGVQSITGWVDDQWVLIGYDEKNKLVYLDPQYAFKGSTVQLKLISEDRAGNTSMAEFTVQKLASTAPKK